MTGSPRSRSILTISTRLLPRITDHHAGQSPGALLRAAVEPSASACREGPQRVPLEKLVQVFKGTYKAPFGIESPLPPHYWELQRLTGPDLFIRGTRSDKTGVSGIIDGKKLRAADAEEKWYLVLRPDLSNEDLAIVAQTQEVWIDIEKNTWVALPAFPQQEQRKLIRIPLWTSRWKVLSGGFVDGPPGSFLIDGTLTTADIRAKFGTGAKPWPIQIDFGWWMTFVQFHHYDHALKMFFAVPPGAGRQGAGLQARRPVAHPPTRSRRGWDVH